MSRLAILALLAAALGATPTGDSTAQREPVARYFDSANGSDEGPCTQTVPCRTLARYRVVARSGDPMVLIDGSVFREHLPIIGAASIRRSRTGATRPAVSGADLVERPWTHETGALWFIGGVADDPIVFFHDGAIGEGDAIGRAPRKPTKAALAAQWDYYWDRATHRLYVHSRADPATLARVLELGVRRRYADIIRADGVVIDGLSFYGTRGGDIGLLAYRRSGSVLSGVEIHDCAFGPSGGQHIQFNGANGRVIGNSFVDWNVEGGANFYAWQGIAEPGMRWRDGAIVRDNTFALTIARPTLGARRPIDSGAITADSGYWAGEISNNRMAMNGLGGGVLVFRPTRAAALMRIERNVVSDANTMALDLSDFTAPTTVLVRRNLFRNANRDEILDTESVRFRAIGAGARLEFHANVIDRTHDGRHPHPGIGVKDVAAPLSIAHNTILGTDIGVELKGQPRGRIALTNNLIVRSRNAALRPGGLGRARLSGNLVSPDSRRVFTLEGAALSGELNLTDPENGDFRPRANSAARGAGADRADVSEDFEGRKFAEPPTVGAYETGR